MKGGCQVNDYYGDIGLGWTSLVTEGERQMISARETHGTIEQVLASTIGHIRFASSDQLD